jgi:hypothetical protein
MNRKGEKDSARIHFYGERRHGILGSCPNPEFPQEDENGCLDENDRGFSENA